MSELTAEGIFEKITAWFEEEDEHGDLVDEDRCWYELPYYLGDDPIIPGLGEVEVIVPIDDVLETRETCFFILKFDGRLFRIDGYYNSYESSPQFDEVEASDFKEVTAVTKPVVFYE